MTMAKSSAALKAAEPPRSPAREALAAAIDEAHDLAAKRAVATALGEDIKPGLSPSQARVALEHAKDALVTAEEAKRRISAEVREAETAVAWSDPKSALRDALRVDPAVRAFVERFGEMT